MATNQPSLGNDQFFWQLVAAIKSAHQNTSLEPYLIYDGKECDRLEELRDLGVTVVFHELSIKSELTSYVLRNYNQEVLAIRSGAYLRSDIPIVAESYGIDEQFLLYTDADVLFLKECDFSEYRPDYFAATGRKMGGRTRFKLGSWKHYNSGVMIMNLPAMRREHGKFVAFVRNNGIGSKRPPDQFMQKNLFMSDEVALNLYYHGKIDDLSEHYNWHPSRGVQDRACIVHFNGLKWTQWDDFLRGDLRPDRQEKFTKLVQRNRAGYEHYVNLARSYL